MCKRQRIVSYCMTLVLIFMMVVPAFASDCYSNNDSVYVNGNYGTLTASVTLCVGDFSSSLSKVNTAATTTISRTYGNCELQTIVVMGYTYNGNKHTVSGAGTGKQETSVRGKTEVVYADKGTSASALTSHTLKSSNGTVVECLKLTVHN